MKTLGTKEQCGDDITPIYSNDLPWCLDCKEIITEENDSGWEAFTFESDGRNSHKLCKICDRQRNKGIKLKDF